MDVGSNYCRNNVHLRFYHKIVMDNIVGPRPIGLMLSQVMDYHYFFLFLSLSSISCILLFSLPSW